MSQTDRNGAFSSPPSPPESVGMALAAALEAQAAAEAAAALAAADVATLTTKVTKTSDTGSAVLPVGTTAERDAGTPTGYLRYNATLQQFEGYGAAGWGKVGGGATGGGTDAVIYLNGQTITSNYTIPAGQNAGSFGPISIADGVSVTIPTGSTWSIV